jgi:hypothetical protein
MISGMGKSRKMYSTWCNGIFRISTPLNNHQARIGQGSLQRFGLIQAALSETSRSSSVVKITGMALT